MNYSGMMAAFCERLCWTDFSVLFLRISEKINWQVKEELLDLMQIPSLRPERARSLYESSIQTVESIVDLDSVDKLVKIFAKNDGFVTHRKSNSDDLRLKYDYLYSLAHKVLSEAKQISIKRKFDPDCTMNNYLQQQPHKLLTDADYVLLSDDEGDSSLDEYDEEESLDDLSSDSIDEQP